MIIDQVAGQAEEDLTFALSLCPPAGKFTKNRESVVFTPLSISKLIRGAY